MALDALDKSICAVLGSDRFPESLSTRPKGTSQTVRTRTSLIFVSCLTRKVGIN